MNSTPQPGDPTPLDRAAAFARRWFDAAFFLLALPFLWKASRNIAATLQFEDALIVLRYARNIASGEGFVFNPGERVLGVTTPLHTLVSALYVAIGGEHAAVIQNVAGIVFLLLTAWMTTRIVRQGHSLALSGLMAIVILANLNFNYLYFGMETHSFAFLTLLAFHLFTQRREVATGVVLGIAFLTRYDAALLALLIGLVLLFERRKVPWRLVVAFTLVVTPWLVFSLWYFHSILPNALSAKKDYFPVLGYLRFVFDYYRGFFANMVGLTTSNELIKTTIAWLFPLICLPGIYRMTKTAWDNLVLITYSAGLVLVYSLIGPDPRFHWHYYILNPVLTMLFLVGLYEILRVALHGTLRVISRLTRHETTTAARLATTIPIGIAAVLAMIHVNRGLDYKFQLDPHSKQLYAIADWLNQHYDDDTSLLQPSIGILGYATNMRIIDHAGLVTEGLYYYDGVQHTPMMEVLARHQPDLVLVLAGAEGALAQHGYAQRMTFHDPLEYVLYALAADAPDTPQGTSLDTSQDPGGAPR
ncbi:MAG: hypothetical protein AAF560_01590 [Acidobacteriota bacterium]